MLSAIAGYAFGFGAVVHQFFVYAVDTAAFCLLVSAPLMAVGGAYAVVRVWSGKALR